MVFQLPPKSSRFNKATHLPFHPQDNVLKPKLFPACWPLGTKIYTWKATGIFFLLISVTKGDIPPNHHMTKHRASFFAISFLWLLFMSGGHRCSKEWPSYLRENKPIMCCSARNSRGTTTDVLVFGWNVYSLEAAVGLSPLERVFQEVSPRFRPSHSSGSLEMRAVWKRIRASPVLTETHGFVSERTLFPRSPVVASEITRMP